MEDFTKPLLMDKHQIMAAFQVQERTVRNMALRGDITVVQVGGGRGKQTIYAVPRESVPWGYSRPQMPTLANNIIPKQ